MNLHASRSAFTWTELIVVLALVVILVGLAIPTVGHSLRSGEFSRTLSNMKQLHLATQQMALDGKTTDDPTLAWPGDTGGSFPYWANHLVPSYLSTNDFCKLMSAEGKIAPSGKFLK